MPGPMRFRSWNRGRCSAQKSGAIWGRFVGIDLSAEQIRQAESLSRSSEGNIRYLTSPAEEISFPDTVFDAVTACQCFFYFDHTRLAPSYSAF